MAAQVTLLLEYYEGDYGGSNAPHEALGRAARRLLNGGAIYLGGGVGIEKLVGAQSAASYSVQQAGGKAEKFEGPLSAVMRGFAIAGGSTAADTPGGTVKVTDPAAAARLRELNDAEAENRKQIARYERRLALAKKRPPAPFIPGRATAVDDDAWEQRRIDELRVELSQIAAERTRLLQTGKVEEVEQVRPGANFTKVPAKSVAKLKGIIEHYKGSGGFTRCVADQVKHGLSDDHAKRRCAVVKDLGEGTTRWRKGGKGKVSEELERLLSEAWGRVVVVEETLGAGMSVALVEAPAPGAGSPAMVRQLAEGMRDDFTLLALAGHPLALAAFGLGEAFVAPAVVQARSNVRAAGGTVKKRTPADRGKGTPSVGSFDEKKHPRGRAGTAEGGRFVQSGSSGSEVRAVQHRVGAKADGQYGSKTTAAVKAFQRAHRLVVDGVVGHQTALALAGKMHKARAARTGALRDSDREAIANLRPSGSRGKSGAPNRVRGGVKVG